MLFRSAEIVEILQDHLAHANAVFADITAEGGKVKVLVIPTNEELVIARDTKAIVESLAK